MVHQQTQCPQGQHHLLLKPALTVVSINIEGFSDDKSSLLSEFSRTTECDFLCVQETHRGHDHRRPQIDGLTLIVESPHPQYGSAIFAKPDINIVSACCQIHNSIEFLTVDTGVCTVTSVYKPPNQPFEFVKPSNFDDRPNKIVIGDFNSHSISWGYRDTNNDGNALEEWADSVELNLIHDSKLPASFNSGRWKRGYNPDLIFVSSNISPICKKSICAPIPHTQHRPIVCQVQAAIKPIQVPFKRRFNFSKANWEEYAEDVDKHLSSVESTPANYEKFVDIIWTASRKNIPRGCRTSYIPGISPDSTSQLTTYEQLYNDDPFSEETIAAGEELMHVVSANRRDKWVSTVTSIDMTQNSRKAWQTVHKLTGDPPAATTPGQVTANQVAHQLILNGKPSKRSLQISNATGSTETSNSLSKPFTLLEVTTGIKNLKNGKAAGIDDITTEQIKHLGPQAVLWLHLFYNTCLSEAKIPKHWRKSKVIALLKPGKSPDNPKHYRPISLLCHTYKLFERLILNRLTPVIDPNLIPEQASFRPGKCCSSQILKLTQHIEDGFESKKITGLALVDLSAAYDTVNIKRLLVKVGIMINDAGFIRILSELLYNRRFQVHLHASKSRWRNQKNGLPQGSVLAPALFNIFTNDQPSTPLTNRFLYADDLALTTQTTSFEEAEKNLQSALDVLTQYYDANCLKPNPSKTQVSAFHLRNCEANRKLIISWQGVLIEHCPQPKYLGVILDRTLSFKNHCLKTKLKVSTRNNLLRRLTTTKWGAAPEVLRTTGMALCFSAGEFACPVWHRSVHAKHVDIALNETCRTITGCLKPTSLNKLYPLAGIAPPSVRRDVACISEKSKQETDCRHPLYEHQPTRARLKSRKSFIHFTQASNVHPAALRVSRWKEKHPPPTDFIPPYEHLPPGYELPWPVWKSLNRLRTQTGRCRENLCKWGMRNPSMTACDCGAPIQSMAHTLICPLCPNTCTRDELNNATHNAIEVAKFYSDNI